MWRLRPQVGLAAVAAGVWLAMMTGALTPIEDGLATLRFKALQRAPSHQITVVEIDVPSLRAAGRWPWGRDRFATAIGNLQAAGAGLYLVNENLGTSTTTPDASTITPSAPFLVTLPMTDPVNLTSWMYDVYVYPKNQADSILKTVTDGNLGTTNQNAYTVGQNLTYHLASTIQATDSNGDGSINGADLSYYYVGDNLSTYVDAQSVTVSVGGTPLIGCDATAGDGTNCDYYYWLDYAARRTSTRSRGSSSRFARTSVCWTSTSPRVERWMP